MRYNNYHKHDSMSNLSSPDSNASQEDYIKRCIELGHTNYFTTNHGNFGDIFEARTLCDKYGLRCIAGIEGYIVPNPLEKDNRNYHIIVIPKTDEARKKMNYVSTHANVDGFYYKPRFFLEDLLALDPNDVFVTNACVAGLLRDEDSYKQLCLPLIKHFGDNFLLEVQSHPHQSQVNVNIKALYLHQQYGLKLVAANDSHYIDEEGRLQREELLHGKHMKYDDESTFILDFPTDEVMFDRFQKQGVLSEKQIEDAINNTLIFDECEEIQLDHSIKMPTIYPDLTPAERVDELKKIVKERFAKIIEEDHITKEELPKYIDGINYEMKIIEDTNEEIHTADYFLFNTKNVDLAVNKYDGVLTRGGRGSCASFYINRILGMTQLDRFKINLPIFPDRFASTARLLSNRAIPDIDYNCRTQEPFVAASRELLGEHGCYPMYAPGTMQLSEAFRNVCRSKNLPYDTYNEIAKDLETYRDNNNWKPIIEEAENYVGTIISGSVHPCAFLLSDKDIRYEYGLARIGENLCVLVTSSEADEYKLLKNDYLIVSVWKLIDETFKKIGQPIMPARELLETIKDDEEVWKLFELGLTCSLNQVDSDNGMQQAKQYGIKSFEDGALIAAAIRPSFDAWRSKFLNHEDYSTGSKALDEVLSLTHHYILYQENLMQYFDWLGVSPAESIGLIKKISKKKIKEKDFKALEERIKKTWIEKTGSEEMFDETWEMIQGCMAYGFAAPHAAATSLDMCYGAYLKAHYPYEYYTVCFDHYSDDQERTRKLTNELEYFGITLSSIRFRYSEGGYSFNKEEHTIYKGLSSIKYLGNDLADELYELGKRDYTDFIDLLQAIDETSCDSRQLDILIKLEFFKEFGSINMLLKQVEIYSNLKGRKQIKLADLSKYNIPLDLIQRLAQKQTAKMFKDFDWLELVREMCKLIPEQKTSIVDILKWEQEYLGYMTKTIPNAPISYYFVTEINNKYKNPILTLYRLYDKKTRNIKVKANTFDRNPIEKYNVISIDKEKSDKKWRMIDGKWTQIDEWEDILERYTRKL